MKHHETRVVVRKILDGLNDAIVQLDVDARPAQQDPDEEFETSGFSQLHPVDRFAAVSTESANTSRIRWRLHRTSEQIDLKKLVSK